MKAEAGAQVAAQPLGPASEGLGTAPSALSLAQLLAISVYWFGINSIWGGYEIFGQHQVEVLVGVETRGATLGYLEFAAALVAILVQPTIGTISDYTSTRWGRRKPFILIGSLLDVLLVYAVATSQTVLALALFLLLLQFSSNFAQGPFQGYVPDLVPRAQVNVASGLMGLMRMLGVIVGAALVSTGATTGDYATPLIALGVIEFSLAVATVMLVHEGPVARPRHGRSWLSIAREAWGTDALRERGFVFMTITRLLFLMGPAVFVNFAFYYIRDSLGQSGPDLSLWLTIGTATIALGTTLGTVPGAWLASRIGRKQVIWLSAAVAAVGLLLIARAHTPLETLPGLVLMGLGTGGYIAVDWALMVSTIPRIASGRFMGLANIANSISGPLAVVIGGRVLDSVTASAGLDAGPRATIMTGLLFLAGASLMLTLVRPRPDQPETGERANRRWPKPPAELRTLYCVACRSGDNGAANRSTAEPPASGAEPNRRRPARSQHGAPQLRDDGLLPRPAGGRADRAGRQAGLSRCLSGRRPYRS